MEEDPKPLPDEIRDIANLFCGCCTLESTWGAIVAELERLDRKEYVGDDGLAAAIVDHLKLSDHGTSIRGGWLTERGKSALAWLRENGCDLDVGGPWIDSDGVWYGVT